MRLPAYGPPPAHLKWLLDSDPAIRWQVMNDLTGESQDMIAAERSRVATEGWASPTSRPPVSCWQLAVITLYSLVVLKDLGLDPLVKRKMIDRVEKQLVFEWGNNQPFLHGEAEPCIRLKRISKNQTTRWPNGP
jgi:hypothetical protein